MLKVVIMLAVILAVTMAITIGVWRVLFVRTKNNWRVNAVGVVALSGQAWVFWLDLLVW